MKKVIFRDRKQLEEALGVDFSYLDGENDDFVGYNGQTETSVTGTLSNDEDGEPITTDKYAKSLTPQNYWWRGGVNGYARGRLVASHEKDGTLVETNQDLAGKTFYIPDKLFQKLQNILKQNQNNKSANGYKRLNYLINARNIKTNEMYQLKKFFEENTKGPEYEMIGGGDMANWVETSLKMATTASYDSKNTKKKLGQENAFISPHSKNSKNGRGHGSTTAGSNPNINYY
jgi:hypothetical protein